MSVLWSVSLFISLPLVISVLLVISQLLPMQQHPIVCCCPTIFQASFFPLIQHPSVSVFACEQALLGPLEQQEVCVAKAGLVASLPARTSLLAAANPAGGQYNRAKTLLQNLKMSAAMLSRFDIIFVLLDQPDQRRDERLSEHVMAMHSGSVSSKNTVASVASGACC